MRTFYTRKIAFLLFLCLSFLIKSSTCNAQGVRMLHLECNWEYTSYYERHGYNNSSTLYEVTGTANVEDKEYYVVRIMHDYMDGNGCPPKKFYSNATIADTEYPVILLREEKGKVYAERNSYSQFITNNKIFQTDNAFFSSTEGEHLLYDFTLDIGDEYPINGDVTVSNKTKFTTYDNVERHILQLSNGMEIIEGIGCRNSLGELMGYQSSTATYTENGVIKGTLAFYNYPESGCYEVYDETLTGIQNPYVKDKTVSCYDLSGRRTATPRRGLYIKDGKKVSIR